MLSPATLTLFGDVRVAATGGEPGWTDGGLGKLRFGGAGHDWRAHAVPAEGGLVWQPKLGWTLGATVVGLVQNVGDHYQAGVSEAYLSWKPVAAGSVRFSARAGLMWPPLSLEHSGPDWAVTDTITPSAINSWIGEEGKVVGGEATLAARLGGHRFSLTGGLFGADDTAGALLGFRGWALDDLKALAGRQFVLPVPPVLACCQPPYTHPIKEMDGSLLKRPGHYEQIAWQGPLPVRLELMHYDNRGDPEAFDAYNEWGWRTRFDAVGARAEPASGWKVIAQAIRGRTKMGYPDEDDGERWVETDFRSAFVLLTRSVGRGSVSGRVERFTTGSHGYFLDSRYSEQGWALTLAARRPLSEWATLFVEAIHVSSRREARADVGLDPRQHQEQLQSSLRLRW
ncbi:hypothetical protein ABDK56_11005 [Sphingomonas sp. ASV193]|uniref:hypothetical protein n=1 Tax=Sphingomonas sp. ASV193 TaxID=3144405 RepID=UPI0032E854C5